MLHEMRESEKLLHDLHPLSPFPLVLLTLWGSSNCMWEVQLENPLYGGPIQWDRSSMAGSGTGPVGSGGASSATPIKGPSTQGQPTNGGGGVFAASTTAHLSVPIRLRNVVTGMFLVWKSVRRVFLERHTQRDASLAWCVTHPHCGALLPRTHCPASGG